MQRREKRPLNCWRHSHVLGAYLRKILPQKKEKNQTLIGNFDQEIGEIVQIDSCSSMCIVIMQQAFIIWWYQALMFEFPWFYFQWMTLTLIQLLCYSWDWIVPFFLLWRIINQWLCQWWKDSWKLYNKFGLHFIYRITICKHFTYRDTSKHFNPSSKDFLS